MKQEDYDDLRTMLLNSIGGDCKIQKPIGRVSDDLKNSFAEQKELQKKLDDDLARAVSSIVKSFETWQVSLEENRGKLWEQVYSELSLDPGGEYTIDTKTGIVTEHTCNGCPKEGTQH